MHSVENRNRSPILNDEDDVAQHPMDGEASGLSEQLEEEIDDLREAIALLQAVVGYLALRSCAVGQPRPLAPGIFADRRSD